MVVDGLDLFNKRLIELNSDYKLKDDPDVLKDNYNVCIASKKSFKPKDDYPPLSMMSSVKEMKKIHYALCCFSSAFERLAGLPSAKSSLKTNAQTAGAAIQAESADISTKNQS